AKKVPILPVTVIGAEEMFPWVHHSKLFSKNLGIPSIPLSANYFPLPSPIDIYIGKPYELPEDLSADAPDKDIRVHVAQLEGIIKEQIREGLKQRRSNFEFLNPLKKLIGNR